MSKCNGSETCDVQVPGYGSVTCSCAKLPGVCWEQKDLTAGEFDGLLASLQWERLGEQIRPEHCYQQAGIAWRVSGIPECGLDVYVGVDGEALLSQTKRQPQKEFIVWLVP